MLNLLVRLVQSHCECEQTLVNTKQIPGLGMGPCCLHIHTGMCTNGTILHFHTYRIRNGTIFFYTSILTGIGTRPCLFTHRLLTDLIFVLKNGVLLLPSLSLPLSCCQEVKDLLQLNLQSLGQF